MREQRRLEEELNIDGISHSSLSNWNVAYRSEQRGRAWLSLSPTSPSLAVKEEATF
jgi:hypothetical protein